jgi:lysophospholipase L1-like esterase
LANLAFHALPYDPDIALIQSTINDVLPRMYDAYDAAHGAFRKPMAPTAPRGLNRWLYRSTFFVALAHALGRIEPLTLQSQTQYAPPPAQRMAENLHRHPPLPYERNLRAMVAICRAEEIEPWLLTLRYNRDPALQPEGIAPDGPREMAFQEGLEEHNAIVRRIAQETQAGLIDLARDMPLDLPYYADPIHMTAEGNRVKAGLIADALESAWRPAGGIGDSPAMANDDQPATSTRSLDQ